PRELRLSQIGFGQLGALEVGAGEVYSLEVGALEEQKTQILVDHRLLVPEPLIDGLLLGFDRHESCPSPHGGSLVAASCMPHGIQQETKGASTRFSMLACAFSGR